MSRPFVEFRETTYHQASCPCCGWHTREVETRGWVHMMGAAHEKSCPNRPPPLNGALMECGCWHNAMPGSSAGMTREVCPVHGDTLMVMANVPLPDGAENVRGWALVDSL